MLLASTLRGPKYTEGTFFRELYRDDHYPAEGKHTQKAKSSMAINKKLGYEDEDNFGRKDDPPHQKRFLRALYYCNIPEDQMHLLPVKPDPNGESTGDRIGLKIKCVACGHVFNALTEKSYGIFGESGFCLCFNYVYLEKHDCSTFSKVCGCNTSVADRMASGESLQKAVAHVSQCKFDLTNTLKILNAYKQEHKPEGDWNLKDQSAIRKWVDHLKKGNRKVTAEVRSMIAGLGMNVEGVKVLGEK